MSISLQPKASSHLPPPIPTDHCGDRVWQPPLRDRRRECPEYLKLFTSIPLLTQITNSVSPTVARKPVNTKFRYEKAHRRRFCSPHPNSSSSFWTEGGADVNTNRWCPAPFGHQAHRWILFSPPFDQSASECARTGGRRVAGHWTWVHWRRCWRTEVKDQQGQRMWRRGEGEGAGDRMQNEGGGLKSLNSFFYFCGSADVK